MQFTKLLSLTVWAVDIVIIRTCVVVLVNVGSTWPLLTAEKFSVVMEVIYRAFAKAVEKVIRYVPSAVLLTADTPY